MSTLALMTMVAGALVVAPTAVAADPVTTPGATVTADPQSPTGYTVTFVYRNPNATQVRLAGDLTLLDLATGSTRYQPEAWQTGRYHAGGTEFLREMTKDAEGNWSVSRPAARRGSELLVPGLGPDPGVGEQAHLGPASTNPRPAGRRPSACATTTCSTPCTCRTPRSRTTPC